eukprot:gene13033-15397_t
MGLGARLKKARASNQEYDTVVILTGTNDLGRIFGDTHFPSEASPEDIAERIRQLHSVCYENGIQQTFLLTVPPSTFSKTDDSRRAALNALLRNFCACEAKARLIDLDLVQLELDSDGLHLSEQGYDAMGDVVADALGAPKNSRSCMLLLPRQLTIIAGCLVVLGVAAFVSRRRS